MDPQELYDRLLNETIEVPEEIEEENDLHDLAKNRVYFNWRDYTIRYMSAMEVNDFGEIYDVLTMDFDPDNFFDINDEYKLMPPPPPPTMYVDIEEENAIYAIGYANIRLGNEIGDAGELNQGMQVVDQLGNAPVEDARVYQIFRRNQQFFFLGVKKYISYLRLMRYPYQINFNTNGEFLIRNPNEDVDLGNFLIPYAATIFCAIQVGRKFAFNAALNGLARRVYLQDDPQLPRYTFQQLFNNGNVIFQRIPEVLRKINTGLYEFISFDNPFQGIRPQIRNTPLQRQAHIVRKLNAIVLEMRRIQTNIDYIWGVGNFNLFYLPNVDFIPSQYPNFLTNGDIIRSYIGLIPDIGAVLNPEIIRDFFRGIFLNQRIFNVRQIFFRYALTGIGHNFDFRGIREMNEMARQFYDNQDNIQNFFQEMVNQTNETIAQFNIANSGFLDNNNTYFTEWNCPNEGVWELHCDHEQLEQQIDYMFTFLMRTFFRVADLTREQINDWEPDFLDNYMTRVEGITFSFTLRVFYGGRGGAHVHRVDQNFVYVYNEPFNYTLNYQNHGIWPANFYRYVIRGLELCMNELCEHYQGHVNSEDYDVRNIRIQFNFTQPQVLDEIGGGCSENEGMVYKKINGRKCHTWRIRNNNCFFKSISSAYESATKKPLNLTLINRYRKIANITKDSLITPEHIRRMNLPIIIRIVDEHRTLLDTVTGMNEPRASVEIVYSERHYYLPVPENLFCPHCYKTHAPRICNSTYGKYKRGELKNFITFSKKKFDKKKEDRDYIIGDIETFPIDDVHTPYAISFLDTRTNEYKLFEGIKCIEEALVYLSKAGTCNLIFHNGSGYDNIIMLNKLLDNFKIEDAYCSDLIYRNGKLMSVNFNFVEKDEEGKKIGINKITFWDSLLHLLSSLDSLCKQFNVPDEIAKGKFDHTLIKSWEDVTRYKPQWEPYLKNDILSLEFIVKSYVKMCKEEVGLNPLNFITLSSLSNTLIQRNFSELKADVFTTADKPDLEKYIRKAIYGGRTAPIKQVFDSKDENDYLTPLDVASLYPAAMDSGDFFIGEPKFVDDADSMEELTLNFREGMTLPPGIYCVHWKPPPYEKRYPIPFLPSKVKGSLLWQYKPHIGYYSDKMIHYANKIGYTFDFISSLMWPGTNNKLFQNTNKIWQTLKQKATLNGDAALRFFAKIGNNSGYGKQIERKEFCTYKQMKMEDAINFLNSLPQDKKASIFSTSDKLDNVIVCEYYVEKYDFKGSPCHLGVVILDKSKIIMYDYFLRSMKPYGTLSLKDCFDSAPYYTDTDSIWIHKKDLHLYADVIGKNMGQLDYDIGEKFKVMYARFLAPKTYFYEAKDDQGNVLQKKKTKGFPNTAISYERLQGFLSNNTAEESKISWPGIQRQTFQKVRKGAALQLKNIVFERVINFSCFKKSVILKEDDQTYFIPFVEDE